MLRCTGLIEGLRTSVAVRDVVGSDEFESPQALFRSLNNTSVPTS